MGVDRTDYVIIGYSMPYRLMSKMGEPIDWWDEDYRPYIEGRRGFEFSIILDNTGDYAVFGKVLARTNDQVGFGGIREITFEQSDFDRVRDKFVELFDDYDIGNVEKPKILAFSNFS
jgi:hypothetical protein